MKNHPSFKFPENLDGKVWRYIDFTKYVSMLSTSSLFFVRADMLDDKFEGKLTKQSLIDRRERYLEMLPKDAMGLPLALEEMVSALDKQIRQSVGICCWHLSDFESAALWKIYLKSVEGVAVQTTFRKLSDCLESPAQEDIFTGMVSYADYDKTSIGSINLFDRFLHKRNCFEFEKEVRSVFFCSPSPPKKQDKKRGRTLMDIYPPIGKTGRNIIVNLKELVESIYVSPYADDWFFELVKSVTKKYGYSFPIIESKLKEKPAY
jgi:hypothetical protein